jgi:hypothetical protein
MVVPTTNARAAVRMLHTSNAAAAKRYLAGSKVGSWTSHANARMASGARAVVDGFDWYVKSDAADGRMFKDLDKETVVVLPAGSISARLDVVLEDGDDLSVAGRQFWLGPAWAGQTVCFWASVDVIHLSIAGARVKSLRSHLSSADLSGLAYDGATPAGPPPLPPVEPEGGAIEVDRSVTGAGIVSLAGRQVLAAEILRGRRVTIRIEPATLLFFDPHTRELLRARPNPLTPEQARRLQGARPAGPPPRPRSEPVTVQRRVSATGTITACRQTIALGRTHAGRIVTVHVCEHTLAIELDDEQRTVRRTTTNPVVVIKGSRNQRAQADRPALSASVGPIDHSQQI